MKTFLALFLILHILSGFSALITGGIASFARKGGKGHKSAGRWYFWSMTGVFVTATVIGILKSLLFLFMVGFFSYYLVVRGYRLLHLKGLGRHRKAGALDWGITGIAMLFGLSLIAWAIDQNLSGNSFWPVPMVFGSISCAFALADVRLYLKGPQAKQFWLTGHIASMGGGYIATWTAFVVTNFHFLPPVLVWLLPGAIGSILIAKSIRKYTPPVQVVKKMAPLLVVLLLLQSGVLPAQTLHGRLSLAGVGADLYVQVQVQSTDTAFSLRQRLLPGARQPLFFTEESKVAGNAVSGRLTVWGTLRYRFTGYGAADSVQLRILDTAGRVVGQLTGSNRVPAVKRNYATVAAQVVDTMQQYLFNKAYLDSAQWKTFATNLKQYGFFLQDDLEFIGAVNREMQKLPFTHCSFTQAGRADFERMVNQTYAGTTQVEHRLLQKNLAYLRIGSFTGDGAAIATAMENIIKAGTPNLVIDLRGNSGGGAGAALQLVRYLSPVFYPSGALVTHRWFDTARRAPLQSDYARFATFSSGSTLALIESLKSEAGVVLAVTPSPLQYQGKLYLLTNSRTASTCEPLVYALKQKGRAVIVGEKTAGAMLSAGAFWLATGYILTLPVADYFTYDGMRLDKVGVEPTLAVPGVEALAAVENLLKEN